MHSADGIIKFAEPILRYYVSKGIKVKVRADAAFADPKLYALCEELEVEYAIRIKENSRLDEAVTDLMKRPEGKDRARTITLYKDFLYQAASWDKPRRIVAKIEHHPGEMFPRLGFIVTNLKSSSRKSVG